MKIIRNPLQMQAVVKKIKIAKKSVGFVPTMGALHEGHLSLIRRSQRDNDITIVSIFVNPAQFGPHEDFKCYPRKSAGDKALLKKEGVDFLFYPLAADMYPQGFKTFVCVEDLSGRLCGKSRPGHFRGVTTVVAKLFNIINADNAYFGQKDAQQANIIKRMVTDLNFPIKITVAPIVREKNGLALSSRNLYLNNKERQDALVLSESLKMAKKMVDSGCRDAGKIISRVTRLIKTKKAAKIDYIALVDCNDFMPVKRLSGNCFLVLAVWIGKTRLIDNIIINPNDKIQMSK